MFFLVIFFVLWKALRLAAVPTAHPAAHCGRLQRFFGMLSLVASSNKIFVEEVILVRDLAAHNHAFICYDTKSQFCSIEMLCRLILTAGIQFNGNIPLFLCKLEDEPNQFGTISFSIMFRRNAKQMNYQGISFGPG